MSKIDYKKPVMLFLLSTSLGAASLTSLGSTDFPIDSSISSLRYGLVFLSLTLPFFLFRIKSWHLSKTGKPIILTWLSFSLVTIIAAVYHESYSSFVEGLWLFFGIPVIFFFGLPNLLQKRANSLIALSLILSHIPYILFSVVVFPVISYPYQGLLGNPNQIGVTCSTIAAGAFILLDSIELNRKSTIPIITIVSILLLSFIFMVLSNSRTSIISFFLMLIILMANFFSRKQSPRKNILKFIFLSFPILALLLSSLSNEYINLAWSQTLFKFSGSTTNDFLSGRTEVWETALEEVSFLGHGSEYFDTKFGISAHNSIIQALGCQGALAALMMFFFAIVSIFYSYRYMKDTSPQNNFAISPLMIAVCFWTLSMGEVMFGALGRGLTLAYFLSIGVVITQQSNFLSTSKTEIIQ
ncbi:MAG: O-antigen ligase family protein [Phormidesmis sp. CAN_BIN44]|nr:O-antigen ligase family protein [Phormidesmis sp. CAN_BIN44]